MSLTYTFDQARYRVDVVNGQSAIFPYSTLYKVRPFQDGVILEVHRSQGHWIRPSHFATRQEFDQVREWIAAAGKGR
jgi:hypothetical protein